MENTYFLSHAAEHDIEEIINYIVQENIQTAYNFIDTLYDTFDKLAENPYLGHVREDLTDHPVRFLTFKWHYLVIYKPDPPLEIVRVLSGLRDIANLI